MKQLLLFGSLLVLLSLACTPPIYFPNQINTPLMSEKGDLHANASLGINGFNLQGAYAATENVAVMGAGSIQDLDGKGGNRVWQAEAGAGYFRSLSKVIRFESYGILGIGNAKYASRGGKIFRAAIQPGIAFSHDIVDLGITPRLAYVRFYDYVDQNNPTLSGVHQDLFFEPTATVRIGYRYVKAQGQMGFSFPLSSNFLLPRIKGIFTLGLVVNLNVLEKKDEAAN